MRHLRKVTKLGRTSKHKEALVANLVSSLIQHSRIQTTLAKAKVIRPVAEKLVTLAKGGTLHDRRLAVSRIRNKDAVKKLFAEIGPRFQDRQGGYTRILKLGHRTTDAAKIALIEWVDYQLPGTEANASAAAAATVEEKKAE
ncbi:LSU ribosomal protein L17P [Verrucomicrobium sp. GAS474]|uniref:50S ribosomal protein L17 n=1 Tax=Verrucomicrobium sp. GAS474 TaxID=1882831 RepID=UPI00087BC3C2|nr:50S ribosomal protein L17 [Verrucomicrobium sp. GAS474]SDU25716.1 LSU ribosomal protein L17P [Verrucomicrobium sp. GAS474]